MIKTRPIPFLFATFKATKAAKNKACCEVVRISRGSLETMFRVCEWLKKAAKAKDGEGVFKACEALATTMTVKPLFVKYGTFWMSMIPCASGRGSGVIDWDLRFSRVFSMMVKSSCWDMDSLAASSMDIDDCILSRLAMGVLNSSGECF